MAIVTCVAAGAVAVGVADGCVPDLGVLLAAGRCPHFVPGSFPVPLVPVPLVPGWPLVLCDPADVPGGEEAGVIRAHAWAAACSAAVPTYGGIG